MKIIAYTNEYAQLVADMWNKSGANWGDEQIIKTAEDVINSESNSGNLKLYLAIEDKQCVGYCSFSEYEYDTGASYLPLLNVRPDYHGKGIGKALILKVVEEAVKSDWPRFDLFTWSGNIKAMPLYKKCGFFWEKYNNSVHLMNFIPYLYQTEALTDYLKDIDWYKDSKRVIDMDQDGQTINGFDYFRYDFENNQTKLAFEFEKTSRGLRLIDTPDYSIEMTLTDAKPVFNRAYLLQVKIMNKTDKTLNIELNSSSNKHVKTDFKEVLTVTGETILEKSFKVLETKDCLDKMKTYPYLETNVLINGKSATFKLGFEPKSPLEAKLIISEYTHMLNQTYEGYINLENNLNTKTDFNLEFKESNISVKPMSITLDSKEKRSIVFSYQVNEIGFYDEPLTITYQKETVKRPLKGIIKGFDKPFHAAYDDHVYLVNGNFIAVYSIEDQSLSYINDYSGHTKQEIKMPQIGLPYSLEFSNINPIFTYPTESLMDITFVSKTFKDVLVIMHVYNLAGILKVTYELINKGPKRNLALAYAFWTSVDKAYIPYNNKILKSSIYDQNYFGHIDSKSLDEHWIYNYENHSGIIWGESGNVFVDEWQLKSAKDNITLDTLESYLSDDIYITYVHSNLNTFRKFAGYTKKKKETSFLELEVNLGNPFSKTACNATLINQKKRIFEGTFACDELTVPVKETLRVEPGLKTFTVKTNEQVFEERRQVFKPFGEVLQIKEDDIRIIDNGVLSFKLDINYSASLYSLTINNQEWLDSNYPETKSRAWWGSFVGGINFMKRNIQDFVILKEPRKAEFISLKDTLGNQWSGIKSTISFEKEESIKGLTFENYFMTLPGVPLIYSFNKIINHTGKLMKNDNFIRFNTLQCDNDLKKVRFNLDGKQYFCHEVGIEKGTRKIVTFESTREHKLVIYNEKNDLEIDTQKQYTICFSVKKLTIPDKSSKQLCGDFLIFTKEDYTKEELKDLGNIEFKL